MLLYSTRKELYCMKLSASEQESIVALLTRIYFDIAEIESRYQLLIGHGDFRPRIEYFHDAVRAFTSKDTVSLEGGSRLSVEHLTYDLNCLRYIQSMPLAPFQPHQDPLSPHQDIVAVTPGALTVKPGRPDREVKQRLVELYQHYAILFAALLKPLADADFHERTDNYHQDVRNIHALMQQLEKNSGAAALADSIQHIEDETLRQALLDFLRAEKHLKKPEVAKLLRTLKGQTQKKNKAIAGVETAHMEYGLAQLGLYEDAKEIVKKMAVSGMNLAGRFVEEAVAETRREMGR